MTIEHGFPREPEAIRPEAVALVEDVVDDADADGVVVGLSGGIDSTVTAHVAVEALGSGAVTGYTLPAAANSHRSVEDARRVADRLDVAFDTIDVQPVLERFLETAFHDRDPVDAADEVAIGNATARLRMAALYLHANASDRLVLGTGNRTELLLGYFTKYGDGGVDLLPIGDLYKTEVRALARSVGVPDEVVRKPPTAGLWEGQRDEAELGAPYEAIDRVLHRHVDRQRPVDEIVADVELDEATVRDLLAAVEANRHKRTPPPTPATHGERWTDAAGEDGGGVRLTGSDTLSDVHMQHLLDLLERPPAALGFEARRWTPALLQRYVKEAYGTDYPLERIERLLDGLEY